MTWILACCEGLQAARSSNPGSIFNTQHSASEGPFWRPTDLSVDFTVIAFSSKLVKSTYTLRTSSTEKYAIQRVTSSSLPKRAWVKMSALSGMPFAFCVFVPVPRTLATLALCDVLRLHDDDDDDGDGDGDGDDDDDDDDDDVDDDDDDDDDAGDDDDDDEDDEPSLGYWESALR